MKQTLYHGGDILTMEEPLYAEAVLVEDGRIAAVGTLADLERRCTSDTERVDLGGCTLLPAFIDSHSHLTALAGTLGLLDLEKAACLADITEMVREFKTTQQLRDGEWIVGFGYDHNRLAEKCHPDRFLLDEAAPHNPVLIAHASGHMGAANSAALQELGVDAATVAPEGGTIGRVGNTNEPNGYLEETAFTSLSAQVGQAGREQLLRQLEEAQQIYLQHGITTVQDGLTKEADWALLSAFAESGRFTVDVISYLDLNENSHLLKAHPQHLKRYHNRLKIGGYKIFLDGSPQGRTAWMSEPYLGERPDYRGYPTYDHAQVSAFMEQAVQDNVQLLCHCNGDAAAQQMIDCWPSDGALRPVMIHAQLVREDQLRQMAQKGMLASFFVAHTYYWGEVHRQNFGDARAMRISPARSAIRNGVIYTFHQDTPVLPPDMLMTVWCAVNRLSRDGILMGEEEKLTPLEALRGVTVNAAYQCFEEEQKGSLRPGKLADMVILSHNPLKVDPIRIREIRVLQTIKEGQNML